MKLNNQHHKAIELLATGSNGKEAAEKLGVAQETISRWRADFEFQAALNKLLEAVQRESSDKLRYMATLALTTLESIMTDTDTPARDKLTACIKILEIGNVKPIDIGSTKASVLENKQRQAEMFETENITPKSLQATNNEDGKLKQ